MSLFDKEHMMRARNMAAELGIELTLEEFYELKDLAFKRLREILNNEGLLIPENDEDLLKLINIIIKHCSMTPEMIKQIKNMEI